MCMYYLAPSLIAQSNQASCASPTSCMMIKEDVEAPLPWAPIPREPLHTVEKHVQCRSSEDEEMTLRMNKNNDMKLDFDSPEQADRASTPRSIR